MWFPTSPCYACSDEDNNMTNIEIGAMQCLPLDKEITMRYKKTSHKRMVRAALHKSGFTLPPD